MPESPPPEAEAQLYPASRELPAQGLPLRAFLHRQSHSERHYHDFEELVCVLEGTADHESDGVFYTISAGDIFLIPRGCAHAYHNAKHLFIVNILFAPGLLAENELDLREIPGYRAFFETEPALRNKSGFKARLNLGGKELGDLRLLILKLERECSQHHPGYRFLARAYFHELVARIARSYDADEKKYSRKMITISRMLAFVEEHYHEPISRDDVVRAGRVSTSSAKRLFAELLHKSISDFIGETRLIHARKLLETTDCSISEIAFRCGFTDSNYFSSCFRRELGISPRAYRGLH